MTLWAKKLKVTLRILSTKYKGMQKNQKIDLASAAKHLNQKILPGCASYNENMNQLHILLDTVKLRVSCRGTVWTAAKHCPKKKILETINEVGVYLTNFLIVFSPEKASIEKNPGTKMPHSQNKAL